MKIYDILKFLFFFIFLLFFISNVYSNESNIDYYEKYIKKEINFDSESSIINYADNLKSFTVGCISKNIFGATTLLFSKDKSNYYLFKNKGLDITIGELLNNKLNYLNNLDKLTNLQIEKLNFIRNLLSNMDDRIYNTKIYQILNYTSIFADDFNNYLMYLFVQKILSFISNENYKKLLIMNGIQYFSILKSMEKVDEYKYSSMGYMYLIGIMSLITEEKDFYEEINNRIFRPLSLENSFSRIDLLKKDEIKKRFGNQNYYDFFKNKKIKLDIYDFYYNEMDTLHGGLISNLKATFVVTREISKMYMGIENKLSNDKSIVFDYFYRYSTKYKERNAFKDKNNIYCSLGSYFYVFNDEIKLETTGDIFGRKSVFGYIYKLNTDFNYKNKILKFEEQEPKIQVLLKYRNIFLTEIFFRNTNTSNSLIFENLLVKSLFNLYKYDDFNIDTDEIEFLINNNSKKLINDLKNEVMKNILKEKIEEKRERLKSICNIYFKDLDGMLN